MIGADLVRAVPTGGYPEMLDRERPDRRSAWARSYIRAIVQRDVRVGAAGDRAHVRASLRRRS